jgi:glycosyltransferase involved in cell wall biosynthesis
MRDIMKKIAIIDVIGLTYDATTIEKYGLGGSESAIIYMAKELSHLGFDVTVFNNCLDSRAQEGIYDGVKYVDLRRLHHSNDHTCDVMIASRTVVPFLPDALWGSFNYPHPTNVFSQLKNSAKHKVLWLHDTFCSGDQFLEQLLVNKDIDEIFTLSDFHTSYVTNCDHGKRRNFEVLKNKVFMTRNGAKKWIDEVDITKKDPTMFVYNASITKGMLPLLERVWPEVKKHIPEAKLTVIGGYYRFRDGAPPDAQEVKFHEITAKDEFKTLDVTFTGVIPQKEIANHLAKASFMIFPGAFPETFGISSLESLLYNTPLITTRFGALEETALETACYKIDYAIEPNSLFREIDINEQVKKFVELTISAYKNKYLHQQKMQYCNIVHDIAGWDTVALQWKQHIFKKLGLYLSVDEFKKVSKINQKVHEVFDRRFSNQEEWNVMRSYPQQKITILTPFFNAADYVDDCILSVASQDYDNYTMHLIDDCSTDNSAEVVKNTLDSLPENIRAKFKFIRNSANQGAVYNQVMTIVGCNDDEIIMLLDGDDKLINDNNIFHFYNNLYDGSTEFTYGSMLSQADRIPLIAQEYPTHVKNSKSYRAHRFNWGIPYTHLRTFKKYLINEIPMSEFQDETGSWFKAGGDNATFYNILEKADPNKVKAVKKIVYSYNDKNPLNDYKVNSKMQDKNSNQIRNKINFMNTEKKKVLLAIPTNKYIEPETFKSIYDLDVPDNIEITFQYFYGYQIDQIRNLIAHWASHFDYLFSVDSDIVLPKDSLVKMLAHDVDVVSGVYIQRKKDTEIPEIYRKNNLGGVSNVSLDELIPTGLHEIDACGFGCVLVKSDVIRKIGYPQFTYHSALNHVNTISEDVDFCRKAKNLGARIFVDSTIVCDHIGNTIYRPVLE